MKRWVAIVVLTAVTPLGAVQQKSDSAGPADPAAPVPPVKYESPFRGFAPYSEQNLAPWRDVNDEVARAGGHVGIVGGSARSGHAPAKPAAKSPAAAASAKPQVPSAQKPDLKPGPAQGELHNH